LNKIKYCWLALLLQSRIKCHRWHKS